jgi:hypothetical protein
LDRITNLIARPRGLARSSSSGVTRGACERAREHVRIGFPRTHRIRIVDSTNRRDRSAILLKRLATGQPVINVKLHERQRPKP